MSFTLPLKISSKFGTVVAYLLVRPFWNPHCSWHKSFSD